jgi:hypothetical protein
MILNTFDKFMKIKDIISNPFVILTSSLVLVLIVSQLIQDGMFMDGSLYVCVSHNLSQGLGSFWEPNYSKTSMIIFREQPPLYFGLMAIFFKLFGSSMYVERFFCFCCLILELFFIVCLWRSIVKDQNGERYSWLPILFFIITPIVFWSYANLVEETVMVIFATLAVLFSRYAILEQEKTKQFVFITLAAIAIVLSTLTKGIQGSFPLSAVFIFWIFERNVSFKRTLLLSTFCLACFIGIYLLMFFIDDTIFFNLKLYLENRLSKAFITGVHNTTDNHFYLFFRLLSELTPLFILLFFILFLVKRKYKNVAIDNTYLTSVLSFILIGFSGTLPLMLTKEQRGFYMLTALPFFTLAFALFILPYVSFLIPIWKKKIKSFAIFQSFSMVLFAGSVIFTIFQVNECKRDNEVLHDIYLFLPMLPNGSLVGLSDDLSENWSIRNYLVRYKYISSDFADKNPEYLIWSKKQDKTQPSKNYHKVDLNTESLDLYIKY